MYLVMIRIWGLTGLQHGPSVSEIESNIRKESQLIRFSHLRSDAFLQSWSGLSQHYTLPLGLFLELGDQPVQLGFLWSLLPVLGWGVGEATEGLALRPRRHLWRELVSAELEQ